MWPMELYVTLVLVPSKINEGIVRSFICLSLHVSTSGFLCLKTFSTKADLIP